MQVNTARGVPLRLSQRVARRRAETTMRQLPARRWARRPSGCFGQNQEEASMFRAIHGTQISRLF